MTTATIQGWKSDQDSTPAGPATICYATHPDSPEGGHIVTFDDGRRMLITPDGHTSAQLRRRRLNEALNHLGSAIDAMTHFGFEPILDPVAYLAGIATINGWTFTVVAEPRPDPGTWVENWLGQIEPRHRTPIVDFLRDLGTAGLEIRYSEDDR